MNIRSGRIGLFEKPELSRTTVLYTDGSVWAKGIKSDLIRFFKKPEYFRTAIEQGGVWNSKASWFRSLRGPWESVLQSNRSVRPGSARLSLRAEPFELEAAPSTVSRAVRLAITAGVKGGQTVVWSSANWIIFSKLRDRDMPSVDIIFKSKSL
jgi:hypothetical protein